MSAVDPLAAAVAAADADVAALVDAELAQLAADAQALRGLLVEDAVVTARVLPSNGLTDLLEIAGRRVAASLPPTVRPGEALQVRVTGFDGDRVLLQIVATGADAAVETGPPAGGPGGAPVVPGTGPAATPPPAAGIVTGPGATAPQPGGPGAPYAGSASAGDATVMEIPLAVPPTRPGVGSGFASAVLRANVVSSQTIGTAAAQLGESGGAQQGGSVSGAQPGESAGAQQGGSVSGAQPGESVSGAQPGGSVSGAPVGGGARSGAGTRAPVGVPAAPTSIEARLAAARATIAQRTAAVDADVLHASPVPPLGSGRGFVAPPQIITKTLNPGAAAAANRTGSRGDLAGSAAASESPAASRAASASTTATSASTRTSALAAYAEPVALLRALRLPVTPSNVSSATLALQHPDRLPDALAALERALPRASDDPNVATLRTLLSFVGRIDPRSPALAAQIAAYVDHVVDGAEPKLATLLAARDAGGGAMRLDAPPSLPAALAAERSAALNADLKQTLLAVAANLATPESLAPSLAGALTALTAVQVSAAQALAAQPDGLAFTIPLATQHGTASAQISVKRDAPDGRGGARVDPANFRIAFVLDTAHYGTVAIDLVTVGRDVTVDVRAESASSMRAFRDALGTLTARLESLRYRVASAGASVGTTSTVAIEAPPSRPVDPDAAVDRSA